MAVAVQNELLVTDGDAAFLRVNNRVPAHALPPGEVAAATNIRFEQGKPCPRFGVAREAWGEPYPNLITTTTLTERPPGVAYQSETITLEVGKTYYFSAGNAAALSSDRTANPVGSLYIPSGTMLDGEFIAEQTTYYVWWQAEDGVVNSATLRVLANTCAYKRFNDPMTQTDNGILVTDEWRDGAGEDGGRGRAWRILPGNGPSEISLNGHDVWGTARLVQCRKTLLLLRHGNERHYFAPADLDGTTDKITLHCAPSWGEGDSARVRFEPATDGAAIFGNTPPAAGNYYYARHFSGNKVKLYINGSDAAADTNALDFTASGAVGKYFIELATSPVPFFGNGAPVLSLQPTELGATAFEGGFDAVPTSIAVTDTDTDTVTCPNHNFVPGDAVTQTGLTIATAGPYYAYPIDDDTISLHTDQTDALSGLNPITDITANGEGSIQKTNASGLPLPPCREGAYINGRFWGINEYDTVIHSDPNDFLHCTLYQSTIAVNQGEAGRANWILPMGESALVIGKDHKLIVLTGIDMDTSGWREGTITGEYGGIAALAASSVGTNLWCLSRKGIARAIRTVAGEKLAEAETVSDDIPEDLRDIDWTSAFRSCSETWNGRYFIAVPTKGQETVLNNKVLVYNFKNTHLAVEQSELAGDIIGRVAKTGGDVDSWEGSWNGDLLTPYAFSRLVINGEERLSYALPNGIVCWLHDGWDDAGAEIESEVLTRGYFGGREMLALRGKLNWDSFNPSATVSIVTAGVNEEETLAGLDSLTYDRTKYLTDGTTDYDPATSTTTQFSAPDREDYSPTPDELSVATLDTHQNLTEPFRCRVRGVSPQLRIANAQGSLRVCSVSMQARPAGVSATRKS